MPAAPRKAAFLIIAVLLAACRSALPSTAAPTTPVPATPTGIIVPLPTVAPASAVPPSASPAPTTGSALAPMDAFMKGVAYAAYEPEAYASAQSDTTLNHVIQPMGVTWISLLATCYQQTVSSTAIACNESTPTDDSVVHAIQTAHSAGLRVMLKPHVDVGDYSHWRGEIDFGLDEAAWKAWFASYTSFIVHYAELAQQTGADYFTIGTEMVGTSRRAAEWRQVIKAVRAAYSGPLTYASNWGEEVTVTWWDALDSIGVDAYYPVSASDHPTVDELKTAWKALRPSLANLSARWAKPIIFTEIGYRSIAGASRMPGDWQVDGALDLQTQANCYQAVFESLDGQPWWQGVFWWAWGVQPAQGGPRDTDFTANNKPAEDVLRRFYGAPPRPAATPTAAVTVQPDENTQLVVYSGGPGAGWEDWSWNAVVQLSSKDHPRAGHQLAISAAVDRYGALSLYRGPLDTTPYYFLEFYLYSASPDLAGLSALFFDGSDTQMAPKVDVTLPDYVEGGRYQPGRWQRIRIPLADMSAASTGISRLALQYNGRADKVTFFVDDLRLLGARPLP